MMRNCSAGAIGERCGRELQPFAQAEIFAGGGIGFPERMRRALENHLPALPARAGSQVDGLVGAGSSQAVVLHEDHRTGQVAKSRQQALHIGGVLPDGGLIQDVQHIFQAADQGQRQAHALGFAARERGRGAVQADIAQPDPLQGRQAALDFISQAGGAGAAARTGRKPCRASSTESARSS